MIEIPIYNQAGQEIEKFQLDESKLGGEVNLAVLKQALVMYHTNKRQGTVRTLARGEVSGSTRKIYRQKGTGNARMGTIRQPVRVGGGHAKQKRPKDWRLAMPKKMRLVAKNSALLAKIQKNDIRVVDEIKLEQPKTKLVVQMLKALGIDRSCLVALPVADKLLQRSSRNVQKAEVTTVAQLNAWDILRTKTLLTTKAGLQQMIA
ncbi:MAG: 50S ribosomal protein L4 [Tepidisphaeraceae bacterium]|jgi:large subunit ribosomal protein L4